MGAAPKGLAADERAAGERETMEGGEAAVGDEDEDATAGAFRGALCCAVAS